MRPGGILFYVIRWHLLEGIIAQYVSVLLSLGLGEL